MSSDKVERLGELVEPWFCFSLVWTVGATCDNHSRAKFDRWMRAAMTDAHVSTHTDLQPRSPVIMLRPCAGSVAEWLACWTQVQKGPGSNRSRDAVG